MSRVVQVPAGVEVSEKARQIRRLRKSTVEPICDTLADVVSFYQAAPFKGFEESFGEISFLNTSENDVAKWNRQGGGLPFVKFDVQKLSRIYPAWWRLLSTNYDPVPHWMAGCQVSRARDPVLGQTILGSGHVT